jgi:hypothetical protein
MQTYTFAVCSLIREGKCGHSIGQYSSAYCNQDVPHDENRSEKSMKVVLPQIRRSAHPLNTYLDTHKPTFFGQHLRIVRVTLSHPGPFHASYREAEP